MIGWKRLTLALAFFASLVAPAFAEQLIALSIGVADYKYLPDLPRSENDAADVANLLSRHNYQVVKVSGHVTKKDIDAGFVALVSAITKAKKSGTVTAVVYYSGHAFEAYGDNWLVGGDLFPRGKKITGEALFRQYGTSINHQLAKLRKAGADQTVLILDACREAKIEIADRRYVSPGLDISGNLIPQTFFLLLAAARESYAYAGLPSDNGRTARNSVFTRYFLNAASSKNSELSTVANIVAKQVYDATKALNPRQLPSVYDQIPGEFFLFPEGVSGSTSIVAQVPPVETPPVSVFFKPNRLRDAQSLAKILKLDGLNYALIADDLNTVQKQQPVGTYRIVRLQNMSQVQENRFRQVLADITVLSDRPIVTRVSDDQLINKPFQIQLF